MRLSIIAQGISLKKALHTHERLHGDKSTLVAGMWEAELERTRQELQRVHADPEVSDIVKGYLYGCWIGIQQGVREISQEPGKAFTQFSVGMADVFLPFHDGSRLIGQASLGGDNAVNDLATGTASLALDGMLLSFGVPGYVADVSVKASTKVVKVAKGAGKFFKNIHKAGMEHATEKVLAHAGIPEVRAPWKSAYWTETSEYTFKGQTNKVYKRDDLIDLQMIDPKGRTNLQLMREGKAPIGHDGNPINLHHSLQRMDSPLVEITQTFHNQYTKIIHINPSSIPSSINVTVK